jgi:transposase
MEWSPFLPLPEGLLIDQVEQASSKLAITVISTRTEAACPDCGHASDHVHSQYQRMVHDVPSGGRQVLLRLCVRKFFCRDQSCRRKVFAQRIADLVRPWGRCESPPLGVAQSHWTLRFRGGQRAPDSSLSHASEGLDPLMLLANHPRSAPDECHQFRNRRLWCDTKLHV